MSGVFHYSAYGVNHIKDLRFGVETMGLEFLIDTIRDTMIWSEVEEGLGEDGVSLGLENLYGSSKTLVLSALIRSSNRNFVVITPDNRAAERVTVDLHHLLPGMEIDYFPPLAGSAINREWPLKETLGRRMETLGGLASGSSRIAIIPCRCLLDEVMVPSRLMALTLEVNHEGDTDRDGLIERLVDLGYHREYTVEEVGHFAVRGGILDIYGYGMDGPVRMEYTGDELVSMRKFDIRTQRSGEEITSLRILPMREKEERGKASPLFSYLAPDTILVLIEGDAVLSALCGCPVGDRPGDGVSQEIVEQCLWAMREMKAVFLEGLHIHRRNGDPVFEFAREIRVELGGGPGGQARCKPGELARGYRSLRFETREPERIDRDMKKLKGVIGKMSSSGGRTVILCDNYGQKERIGELLGDRSADCDLEIGALETGFHLPETRLLLYNDYEIFRRPRRLRYKRRYRKGGGLDSVHSIKPGDYLVHVDYGIGRFEGLKVVHLHDGEEECLSIAYRDGDRVYVPVDKIHLVDRYSVGEGGPPRLHRIGGVGWEKVKMGAMEGIREMAERLLSLYARRRVAGGYAFSEDTPWQLEMESTFAYEETTDQVKSLEEVKGDMTRGKPMDRLICGDVGYGKTEVAVRAAFKAVQDNKQVAVLVPTTILAQQHFMTFAERLSDFPVVIEVLSRFKRPALQKKVVEGLADGKVDIVIGTHRLLSSDVRFRDLGLLIIDEEHRFGVTHKEKIKELKEGVDILQLTATPLPRTLHLALMGIRDISLINTPPQERLPIVTYVCRFDRELIKEAVMREVDRGGQVFFVHNRVRSIEAVATMLRKWLPEIRFAVAHGQMKERDLEDIMLDFMEGGVDVLVSTMIIGSGLDVPNANTLIVNRSDRLGLAQLYQLRGRVGRSYRRAYAYMLTPPLGTLSEEARKRLTVLEEYTELGSGYQIALRDMEIRGVGNILGREQHGFVHAMGLDMYNRLLEEEVGRLRGEEVVRRDVELVTDLTLLLPDWYVADPTQRVLIYRRLSRARDLNDLDEIEEELTDRFGELPREGRNLLDMVYIKLLAGMLGIRSVYLKSGELRLVFVEGKPDNLVEWDRVFRERELRASISQDQGITMVIKYGGDGNWLKEVKKSLHRMV